jgi:hypothetical protein
MMRRGIAHALKQAGCLAKDAASCESAAAAPMAVWARQMSSTPETPLSKFMPAIAAAPRQAFNSIVGLAGMAVVGAATSGPIKSAVSSFADHLVVQESIVNIEDLDPSYWAYWLSVTGYGNQAGFKKLAEAAKAKVGSFSAEQITNLVTGLYSVKYYDKDLFEGISKNISENFTKFETDQLLKIVKAFADNNHFTVPLFDDIADSITYCNHYLAPIKVPTSEVVAALAAYAKFNHDRGDLFVTLTRGISEVGLSKLDAKARRDAVASGLQALSTLEFYPSQTDALLYFTKTEPEQYSAEELKVAEKVTAAIEAQTGGKLQTYVYSHDEDATHWYGHHQHAPSQYELYIFRDSLVPDSYSPASMRSKK